MSTNTQETLDDLIAHATGLELAEALQEVLRTSPRTTADSELLGHLSAWIAQAKIFNH